MAILPFRIGRDGTASCRMGEPATALFLLQKKPWKMPLKARNYYRRNGVYTYWIDDFRITGGDFGWRGWRG